jgi:raffinose/stachyose/melibiose transport system permease protein
MGVPWVSAIPMLLFFAALQGIPASVLESARLDGATGIRRIIHIELPMILGQFKVLLVLGIINGIQGFQTVLIMTFGGPGKATELPGLIMFKEAFSYGRLGYGTAIGVVMFIVILALTFAGMQLLGESGDER